MKSLLLLLLKTSSRGRIMGGKCWVVAQGARGPWRGEHLLQSAQWISQADPKGLQESYQRSQLVL